MSSILILFAFYGTWCLSAVEQRFASGLLRVYRAESVDEVPSRANAASQAIRFLDRETGVNGSGYSWVPSRTLRDAQHSHQFFQLYYQGRRVVGQIAKVHVNHRGFVSHASSPLSSLFQVQFPERTDATIALTRQRFIDDFASVHGLPFRGFLRIEPVVWVSDDGQQAAAALDLTMNSFWPFSLRRVFIDELTGKILQERRTLRNDVSTTNKVYPVNPRQNATPVTVTIPNLNALSSLSNSYIHVRREQNVSTPELVEVAANTIWADQTGSGDEHFYTSPDDYYPECDTGSGDPICANQSFDAVNVYYHVNAFRRQIATYLGQLGADAALERDPLDVIVNLLVSLSNNAAYLDSACTEDGSVERCLLFLRPEPLTDSRCGSSTVRFYNLAREANIAVHEFQHYLTDSLAGFVPGSSTQANVGDVLHEGYSDYFGAAFIAETSGNTSGGAMVGDYAFQECTFFQRNIASVRPIENSSAEADDPHLGGHSFASGLWQLKEQIGYERTNLIALKSLLLLGTRPSSIDAVEALVSADAALYSGDNAALIKSIFYDSIKFSGGPDNSFRDADKKVREIGFRSCVGVSDASASRVSGLWSLLLLALWLCGTWGGGRWWFHSGREN